MTLAEVPQGSLRSRLVVSSLTQRRLDLGRSWAQSRRKGDEILVLGPTQAALRSLLRGSGVGTFGVNTKTLAQWAQSLAILEMARRGIGPVSELGLLSLATRVARFQAETEALGDLATVASLPGFAGCLDRTLRELRLAGVAADDLRARPVSREIGQLLDGFEQELDRWRLADSAAVMELAGKSLRSSRESLPPALWLDLQVWDRATSKLLRASVERHEGIVATVAAGDERSLVALEQLLGVEAEDLEAASRDLDARTDGGGETERHGETALRRAQQFVFQPSSEGRVEAPVDGSVSFFSAAGEGQECVEILRRIRDLAAEGVAFDSMAILLRQPFAYLPLLEDAFRRAEIPAFFSRGTRRPDPAARAFLALLSCRAERLSAERFAEYLSLGQTPLLDDEGAPPVREVPWVEPAESQLVFSSGVLIEEPGFETRPDSPDFGDAPEVEGADETPTASRSRLSVPLRWEKFLVDAAVVGGADRWARRLRGREAELRLQLRELGDEGEAQRHGLERDIERLGALTRFALPLISQLDELPESADWSVWLEALERLATRALRRPKAVLALLADLRPLGEVSAVQLPEVLRTLSDRLGTLQVEPPARQDGKVFVGLLSDASARSFDSVFVPGLAEGVFPARNGEDPLLLDETRQELNARLADPSSKRLMTEQDRSQRERLLLRLALGAADRRIVISYPRIDLVLGRARVPSLFFLDVLRAAEGELPSLERLATRAAEAGAAQVGWPAPVDPMAALDPTEFELSILRELLEQERDTARGGARFLLEEFPHLDRALRSRAGRWRNGWFPDDGLVDVCEETKELLQTQRLRERSYSPTALQHYAACPYRFLLQAIHRLRPRDELVRLEQMDPLTRGSIFHSIQFHFLRALLERGLQSVTSENLVEVSELLDQVVDEREAYFREELAPAIDRVWQTEFENLRTDLRGWLRVLAEESPQWIPRHGELSFGLPPDSERDPASEREPVEVLGGLRLRGSIDWVEEDASGRYLRVTDHKTGRPLNTEGDLVIGGGKVLQPLLYALVAEAMVAKKSQTVSSGRLFYSTQLAEYRVVEVGLDLHGRNALSTLVDTIDGAIEQAFLPAAPNEGECTYCDYRLVCGPYEELRTRYKRDRSKLRGLDDLRARP